jgi:hypothetical protein
VQECSRSGTGTIFKGVTIDATTLAFIIEAAAHQTLTHEERATLVQRVETLNELLLESLRDIRAGKAGERHE